MKLATYRNCAGCGRLFANAKLKRIGHGNHGARIPLYCASCLAKEKFKGHLARIEQLQGCPLKPDS